MKKKSAISLLLIFVVNVCAFAQLSTNEPPVSFDSKLKLKKTKRDVPTVTMPAIDMAKIRKEDEEDEKDGFPPRFGYPHKVNYNLGNSGAWTKLPDGSKLWRLNVVCPGALSINLLYDKFWLPEGGKFFIYSKDRKHSIGAFTSKNNKGDSLNVKSFATGLVYGDDVLLEYYQPKEVTSDAVIAIDYVVQGYRYIKINEKSLGDSGSCQININCPEGLQWQIEKKAVALILVDGSRICTGSLINTTDLSQKPYFLTANHCLVYYEDAEGNNNLNYYSFYWNYEAPGCSNISVEPTFYSTSGATLLANNTASDFALFRLTEDPMTLSNFTPFYLGWDHSGGSGMPGVCIHHPKGDVKKISTVASQPLSTQYKGYTVSENYTHWKVTWTSTQNGHGTTEGGSSGSPLLTSEHKVIGQLHGGKSYCDDLNAPDWYGKFNVSWTGNGNSSIHRRLNCWLDSISTGEQAIEGLLVVNSTDTINIDEELYSNIRITNTGQLTIQSDVEMKGNSSVIVESGGKIIIDGGYLSNVELVLKTGSTLQIINGGVLESRDAFIAPQGATVTVTNGRII